MRRSAGRVVRRAHGSQGYAGRALRLLWRAVDGRNWTLGETQYRWLEKTLKNSEAKTKFVFIHHLVGGLDKNGRGGVEAAGLYEWGGKGADGRNEFARRRPGWTAPIHQLLVNHGVAAVFHGHDHFYARQELDGVIYQLVPQPGHAGSRVPRFAAEYGYREGVLLGGSGHLRVRVTSDGADVEYVRSTLAEEGGRPLRRSNGASQ